MKFGGMIAYYPVTIWLDFGIDRVKGQGQGHEKVNILFESHEIWWHDWLLSGDHLIRFRHKMFIIWSDFGIDRVKGQGQGHEKIKILFLP